MTDTNFVLRLGDGYTVEERYPATIAQRVTGSYEITYLGLTFKIQVVNETICGERAVLSVGEGIRAKKKLVVTPSPFPRKV